MTEAAAHNFYGAQRLPVVIGENYKKFTTLQQINKQEKTSDSYLLQNCSLWGLYPDGE